MRSAPSHIKALSGPSQFDENLAAFVVTDTDGSSRIYAGIQNPTSFLTAMRQTGRRVRPATAAELATEPEDVRLTACFRIGPKRVAR